MANLTTDVSTLHRVGKTTAGRLKKIGITAARDLLFYFPFRYDDFRDITPIAKLQSGMSASVTGQIELIQNKRSFRRRMHITEALISDRTETIKVIWFNQPWLAKNLRVGDKVSLAGRVDEDAGGLVMMSPAYEKLVNSQSFHTQGLVPIYHLTANITQKQIRFLIRQVIGLSRQIPDWLLPTIIKKYRLLPLDAAIGQIHFPRDQKQIDSARRRLAFNELFLVQIKNQLAKEKYKSLQAKPIKFYEAETKEFVAKLPFTLTTAQKKAAWRIILDMQSEKPMARLLEGDVGSGKTIVALIAMYNAALNGRQSVLMVPTEILAKQHYDSVKKLMNDKMPICLHTRSQFLISNYQFPNEKKITKNYLLNCINQNEAKIIIGTHALLQENVNFYDLALAVIDEQHRFGVEQRKKLIEKIQITKQGALEEKNILKSEIKNLKSKSPHLLSMTATPIPRTLALALYGDLDVTILDEMPRNRKKVLTYVVPEEKRAKAYEFIRAEIKKGRQAFVICPLIDISDMSGAKSAKAEYDKLKNEIFPDLNIGLVHGRLKPEEKEKVMVGFLANEINILVATSVIEVGIDVPNTTIMFIEGADRFGLAQLHQFRGRVGRSEHQSYCFLFTESEAEKTLKRLNALVDCYDGFALSKMDLKFRGPGEVYGLAQSGFPELKIATLFDYEIMKIAGEAAKELIKTDPSLAKWPMLKNKLEENITPVHHE